MNVKDMSNKEFIEFVNSLSKDELSEEQKIAIREEIAKRQGNLNKIKEEAEKKKEEAAKLEKGYSEEKEKSENILQKWKNRAKVLGICATGLAVLVVGIHTLKERELAKKINNQDLDKDYTYSKIEEKEVDNVEDAVEKEASKVGATVKKTKKRKSIPGSAISPEEERVAAEYDTTKPGETTKDRVEGSQEVEFIGEDNTQEQKDLEEAMNKENNWTKDGEDGMKSVTDHTPIQEEDKGEVLLDEEERKEERPYLDPNSQNVQENPEHKEQKNAGDDELDEILNSIPEPQIEEQATDTQSIEDIKIEEDIELEDTETKKIEDEEFSI